MLYQYPRSLTAATIQRVLASSDDRDDDDAHHGRPRCAALPQSYDEVREKRKACPDCAAAYARPRVWAAVRRRFLARLRAFEERRAERAAAAAAGAALDAQASRRARYAIAAVLQQGVCHC
jgi:hypothetical protein